MNGASAEAVDVFLQAAAVGVAETIGVHTAEGINGRRHRG